MTLDDLQSENADLRRRLEEAEETIRAIQTGAVDAFVVVEPAGSKVYTLEGADRPYRLLVEQMQQGAATLQPDGVIVYCNRRLAELLETPHEKLIGALLRDFIADDDRPLYDDLLRQSGSELGRGEVRLRRTNGEPTPAYLTFNELPPDCGAAMGVLVTDLTAQRHHEQLAAMNAALQESEERFRTLADNMAQFCWMADSAGWIFWYNQRWYDYTGTTLEEMQGWGWKQVHHPDHLERVVKRVQHSWDTGELWEDIFPLRGQDGNYRWFLSRALPIRDDQGQVIRWFGTNTDITEQREAADLLRKLAAELSEADRRKTEFLGMLAHELRNPLAPIRNAIEIMRLTGNQSLAVQTATDMMERQLGQMVRLVDDLLDVSRISRGTIELRRRRIDLASAVNHAVEAARSLVQCMEHDLSVSLPPQPVHLDADPARLAQVIGNLLNNACKFTEKGGRISLAVSVEDGQEPTFAVIRVQDSGVGIAAEQLPRIFDMFVQVDTSLERSVSGLGIGLALVRNMVEMHGGTVQVHSGGIGQGSQFEVRLPIMTDPAPVPAPEPAPSKPDTKIVRRILVVDDNRDAAQSLAMLLKLTGHQTHLAYDGLEAIDAAAAFLPEVVLLDIGLPKLNGYEVCRRMREQPWGKYLVILALTGWGQDEDRRKTKEAGFDSHLVKPVDYVALTALLAKFGTTSV